MTNPAKAKGDRAELEIARIIADLTGFPARRKLGAGRKDDTGDIDGVPDTTVQVKSYADVGRAVREVLADVAIQQANAASLFGVGFVRRPGGRWMVVMPVECWAVYARESLQPVAASRVTEETTAQKEYPHHAPETALANHRAGREVWDTNGDLL